MKKLILGIIISVVFIYLAFRNIEYDLLFKSINSANYIYLFIATLLSIVLSLLRSIRLQVILSPLDNLTQKMLLPITFFGYLTITLIPMRVGEFARLKM